MTKATTAKEIKREWHLVDVKGKTLGRVSVEIAHALMGKAKPYFVRNLDCGDYVVVVNAKDVKVTGNKLTEKTYKRHSGYPGGFKSFSLREVMEKDPRKAIEEAVKGMLPQNKLRATMLKRLKIFSDGNHTFSDKLKVQSETKGESRS